MLTNCVRTAVLLVVLLLQARTYIAAQNITLSEKKASLRKVFHDIEKQSSYLFWYEYPVIEHTAKITVRFTDLPIAEALDRCLQGQPLKYTIHNKTIIITGDRDSYSKIQTEAGALMGINGTVTDSTGEPLKGVSVSVAGNTAGTVSDGNGQFRLAAPANAVLHLSLVSYQPLNTAVNNKTVLSLVMHLQNSYLRDVVVVGYGSLFKKDITGSVSSISTQAIQNQPLSSFDQAIEGQAAGVQVSQLTGTPGGGAVIRVRGTGSISAGNEPLYVIDGFPIEGSYNRDLNLLATINLYDIESIQVLKDASAVAIYGSRGSNGVVIVNTKRGLPGKAKMKFDFSHGIQQVAHKIDMLNAKEYAAYNTEARNNAWSDLGGSPADPDSVRPDRLKIPPMFKDPSTLGEGTDWQDQVLRLAPIDNYNISISNGTTDTRYLFSAGYFNQKGIVINTGFERYSFRLNLDSKLADKLKIGFNIAPSYSRNKSLPVQDQTFTNSILATALAMPPTVPVFNADGSYTTLLNSSPYNIGLISNPVAVANKLTQGTTAFRTLTGFFAEWELLKGIRLRSSLGADYRENHYHFYWPSDLGRGLSPAPVIAEGIATSSRNFTWLAENTLTWNTSFHHVHFLNAVAGFTSQKSTTESASLDAVNFPTDFVTTLNAGHIISGGTLLSEWALNSYLARVNYSYRSRYLVTATVRRDGSSRFGANRRWGTFPSASAGWNLAAENFMRSLNSISFFKVRAGFGYAGNNTIGDYAYAGLLAPANYVFGTGLGTIVNGLEPVTMGNAGLGWEMMKQTDLGADIGLFNNRVSVTFDYFDKVTSNLLLNVPVPGSIGFSNVLENIGKVGNKGWELTAQSNNLVGNFTWKTGFNFSRNHNKVLELGPKGDPIISSSKAFNAQTHITAIGAPIGSFFGYQVIGVYRDQADVDKNPKVEGPGGSRPGDLKFKDLDGDGVITAADRTGIGNNTPDYIFGFTNDFSYKSFTLSILIDGVQGNEVLNGGRKNIQLTTGAYSRRDVLQRWQSPEQPGDGQTPRANVLPTGGSVSFISTLLVEDASFVRLRNIHLRYSFSRRILNRTPMQNASIFLSMQNLVMITRYKGYNPEQSLDGADPLTAGGDYNGYPLAKVISAGLSVIF